MLTLSDIERAVRASWAADTCSPDDVARAARAARVVARPAGRPDAEYELLRQRVNARLG